MSNIPTAEKFLIDWSGVDNFTHPNIDIRDQWIERKNQLINFAKLHVEAALNDHYKTVITKYPIKLSEMETCCDLIVNSYILDKIT